ncbi:MAG: thioredoxin family protein [Rhodocyclales bacterium]|nr:thioredoxin family protein [Rhodocyclales bacterium]
MPYTPTFTVNAPERAEIDALPGALLLEFGVDWCPHCQGAQAAIAAGLADWPQLQHMKIEDGPGRRLGRSFRVKLWPTLILLRDGVELGRCVRPSSADVVRDLLRSLPADSA